MMIHDFFRRYANTPLDKRGISINTAKYGLFTLHDLYVALKDMDEGMRPTTIRRDNLLKIADEAFEVL